MLIADLYIRVSTDEQADKGYSQRDQEERLRKYCEHNQISINQVIKEDHSAKTFERPEWARYLIHLKKNKGKSDLVLFTKWDRFSRNAGDAYQMINVLRKVSVEPQAIEQPLDMSVPESKIMLAVYLATPEVENDRRALNVINGMRRARKEGRWMGPAPIGYINRSKEDGRKYIAPKDPEAGIMRWVFTTIAEGRYNTEQIWKIALQKKLKCSKNNFWLAIRNPVYCGKIHVHAYKDEKSFYVQGQHEPLISEVLFNEVLDVLTGRRKKQRTKMVADDELPLRGFLICPDCGKILTGSASKGRNGYYHYYHCTSACGCRFKASLANTRFVDQLKQYIPDQDMVEMYKEFIISEYGDMTKYHRDARNTALTQINELNDRLNKARQKLFMEQIEPADFKLMKADCENAINELERKLVGMSSNNPKNIDNLVGKGVDNLMKLDYLYQAGTIEEKRNLIGSIFPENLTFNKTDYRTARINEAVRLIYLINSELQGKKNGTSDNSINLYRKADRTGLEPATSAVTGRHSNQLNYRSKTTLVLWV